MTDDIERRRFGEAHERLYGNIITDATAYRYEGWKMHAALAKQDMQDVVRELEDIMEVGEGDRCAIWKRAIRKAIAIIKSKGID